MRSTSKEEALVVPSGSKQQQALQLVDALRRFETELGSFATARECVRKLFCLAVITDVWCEQLTENEKIALMYFFEDSELLFEQLELFYPGGE